MISSGTYLGYIDWEHYICHSCQRELMTSHIPSKTTVVCVPGHISLQWITELKKHIQNTKNDVEYTEGGIVIGRINGITYLVYPGIKVILNAISKKQRRDQVIVLYDREFVFTMFAIPRILEPI